jgi:dynein heavy chain
MLQDPVTVPDGEAGLKKFRRLWVHEVLRVFYDRLVDDHDRDWLLDLIKELTKKYFKQNFDELFAHLLTGNAKVITQFEFRR